MTRTTTPRSTAPARPAAQVEDDPTEDDIAAVDDASEAFSGGAAGRGTPKPLAATRIRHVILVLGIAVVLALEAIDAIRVVRRRAAYLAAAWWAGVENQERREARRAEIVALAVPIMRAMTDPAPGSGRPPAGTTRPRP